MRSISPDPSVVDLAALQYDCHNIKTAIKCSILGRSPSDMYIPVGTVPTDIIDSSITDRNYSGFPSHMAAAVPEAFDAYSTTRDPQLIDALVDSACYVDMHDTALRINDPFFAEWVGVKADITNILTTVRVMRMGGDYDRAYLERMLVPCGHIDVSLFVNALYDGEAALWAKITNTRYAPICKALENDPGFTLSTVERECEDFSLGFIKDSDRYTVSGAVVVFGYITACEYMVKNLRIVVASKTAGSEVGVIKERMRKNYV